MMNDNKHIESLLHLFMQGETTIEQERELSQYFACHDGIPDKWLPYKDMFAYFEQGMPITTAPAQQRRSKMTRPLWIASAVAAAATIAIVITAVVHYHTLPRNSFSTTPQVAKSKEPTTSHHSTATSIAKPQSMPPTLIAREDIKTTQGTTKRAARAIAHEETSTHKARTNNKVVRINAKPSSPPHLDSIEMERERGQMELVQQELMADRLIIEKEREEALIERQRTRARAFQAQHEPDIYNTAPNAILVVFQ